MHHKTLFVCLLFCQSIIFLATAESLGSRVQIGYGAVNDDSSIHSTQSSPSSRPLLPQSQSNSNPCTCLDCVEKMVSITTCGACTREKFESSGILCCNTIHPFHQAQQQRIDNRRIGYCKLVSTAVYPIVCTLIIMKCPPAGLALPNAAAITSEVGYVLSACCLCIELGGCCLGKITESCCLCEDPKYSDDTLLFEEIGNIANCNDPERLELMRQRLQDEPVCCCFPCCNERD